MVRPLGAADPAWGHSLERLKQAGTLVVTTGQQPALFTGPLYVVYKALSAAALAEVLERRWGRAVVPVFWVAGDDHDFGEAGSVSWLDREGNVASRVLRARPPEAPLTPMYQESLGSEVSGLLAALADDLPASEFRDQVVAWLTRYYGPEATVAGAFAGALAELLARFGVLCLSSTERTVKQAMAPYLLRALELAPTLEQELDRRAGQLAAEGSDPGVAAADGATLVMLEGRLGRDRLVRDGLGFVTRRSGERFTLGDLRGIAAESPQRLSPNVLLRPVVERTLLPTVAYVGGPGELRYLELTPPLYQQLDVPRQLPIPRWSGLMVEPRVDRVLAKFEATVEELLRPGGALEARVLRTQLPREAAEALHRLRATLEHEYGVIARAAAEVDPTIERPVQTALHQALSGARDVEKRLLQHLKKREETEVGQIVRARTALLPLGRPQERVLTTAPFLARYGPEVLDLLRSEIVRWYQAGLEGAPVPT
jgi:bacillithiol biosynthesis cysteine-adding enzyme BshC